MTVYLLVELFIFLNLCEFIKVSGKITQRIIKDTISETAKSGIVKNRLLYSINYTFSLMKSNSSINIIFLAKRAKILPEPLNSSHTKKFKEIPKLPSIIEDFRISLTNLYFLYC